MEGAFVLLKEKVTIRGCGNGVRYGTARSAHNRVSRRLFTWLQQNEGGLNRSAGRYFAVDRAA